MSPTNANENRETPISGLLFADEDGLGWRRQELAMDMDLRGADACDSVRSTREIAF
jgi:hypothetical protein